jgi:hypothetical protein
MKICNADNALFPGFRGKLNRFLATPYYIIAVMALSILSSLLSLELLVYTVFALVAVYTLTLGEDALPLTPLLLFGYISPSVKNNPGLNEKSVFSGGSGVYLLALGGMILLAALWYVVRHRAQFFAAKRQLLLGLAVLAATYLLSGIGTAHYSKVAPRNLLFAAMQAFALLVPYCLLSGGVNWKTARKDYLAWVGFAGGAAVLCQVVGCYLLQGVVVDGVIVRQRIYTGWGMYNNMGLLLAMAIPFAFYLATAYRRGWIGTVVGSVFLMGVLLTCSRTSLIIGVAIYGLCALLMLHYARNPRHNAAALVVTLCACMLVSVLFQPQLQQLFSDFLKLGMNPSSRDVFLREGLKIFAKAPVLGSSFYAPQEVLWDFSQVASLSALIPPRWHSTPLQLLVSCGVVGFAAYGFHRLQTLRLLAQDRSKEKTFTACAVGVVLLCSLFDCHFFNLGPTLFYSAALAFAEKGKQ